MSGLGIWNDTLQPETRSEWRRFNFGTVDRAAPMIDWISLQEW